MDRRDFLGTLCATLGAVTFAPSELLWRPVDTQIAPVLQPNALVRLTDITHALVQELSLLWHPTLNVSMPGMDGRYRHQFKVAMRTPTELDADGLDREAYIYPAACALANSLNEDGLTVCGRLSCPPLAESVIVTESHISLRGMLVPSSPERKEPWLRFDVLAG
jgi:hypothetical protein